MSNFEAAFNYTNKHEGLYSNHPNDRGGETYRGISREFHPNWFGWNLIDEHKNELDNHDTTKLNDRLKNDYNLNLAVKNFYRENYYLSYWDDLPVELVIELYDNAVNMGIKESVEFLQESLNLLNRNEVTYENLLVDGKYGKITHTAVKYYLRNDQIELLLKYINVLQGNHYINIMRKDETQEIFARGWFNRVEITKDKVKGKGLDKGKFEFYMNVLINEIEKQGKLREIYNSDCEFISDRLIDSYVELLDLIMDDKGKWVDYYMWETNFGEKDLGVFINDEKVKLKTIEDLYNIIVKTKE